MNSLLSDTDIRENLSLLGSEHGDYRHAVQWFLAQGRHATPFLITALQAKETSDPQKGRIIETLGELQDGAAVSLLITILRSGELSWECAQALGRIGTQDAEYALIRGLHDERLEITKECTKALGHIRSDRTWAALQVELQHPDASVRYHAIRSLIKSKAPALQNTLSTHLRKEEDPDVRRLIEEYLGSLTAEVDEMI